jgi:hypothetical protein
VPPPCSESATSVLGIALFGTFKTADLGFCVVKAPHTPFSKMDLSLSRSTVGCRGKTRAEQGQNKTAPGQHEPAGPQQATASQAPPKTACPKPGALPAQSYLSDPTPPTCAPLEPLKPLEPLERLERLARPT